MPTVKHSLVVEEDLALAGELKSLLGDLGFEVTTLQKPDRVTDELTRNQYDLAIINVPLPGMTWRRTLSTVKSTAQETTVIMIRECPDEQEIRLALNAGSYAALERPLSSAQLASLITPNNDGLFVALR